MNTLALIFQRLLRLQILDVKHSSLYLVCAVVLLLCQPVVGTGSCGSAVSAAQAQPSMVLAEQYHLGEAPRFVCLTVQHRSDHVLAFNQLFERIVLPLVLLSLALILLLRLDLGLLGLPIRLNQPPPTPPPMMV
jgi:hypothetical protein